MVGARVRVGLVAGVVMLAVAVPPSASGAVTFGEAIDPTDSNCLGGATYIQAVSPGGQYSAPSAGIITSWSYLGAAGPTPQMRLKVVRRQGTTNNFTIVGESELRTPLVGQLNTYATRITVQAGDAIGFYLATTDTQCADNNPGPGYLFRVGTGDPGPGSTIALLPDGLSQLDIAATLETDCDGDGFGDETQDPSVSGGNCPVPPDTDPPETTITKGAPNKLDKSKVKFKFESNDPTAVFECKLKGKGLKRAVKRFSDCDSPRKYKRLADGKFKFNVRATDLAGNVGAPAKDKFKVID